MSIPFTDSPHFRRLLGGDPGAELTRIALECAHDAYPDLDPGRYLAAIATLADRVRARCPPRSRAAQVVGQINWVLYVEEGFRGDDKHYHDPRNSYLNQVIDRKLGIPITLSVLYLAIAERVGLAMAGVNLPGHFVIRTVSDADVLFVDPFHQGARLDAEGCRRRVEEVTGQAVALSAEQLRPCAMAAIVARMLRNLKGIYLREQDFASAWPVQRRLAALAWDEPLEQRDLGVIALQAGYPGAAINPLQAYLAALPAAPDAELVRALLAQAWREVAGAN